MRRAACKRAAELLAGRNFGISEAERLELEGHLGSCQQCAQDEYQLEALLAATGARHVQPLSPRARRRAISSALLHAPAAPMRLHRAPRATWLAAPVALAAAAGLLLSGPGATDRTSSPPAARPQAAPRLAPPTVHRVISGDVRAGTAALAAGDPIGDQVELVARRDSELSLAHARLSLKPRTRIRWHAEATTVDLRRGVVNAAVDPEAEKPFRIKTASFSVVVLGTRFEVTPQRVMVFEGHVRIEDPDGAVLVAGLGAGQQWSPPSVRHKPPRQSRNGAGDQPDAQALLRQSRQQLAERRTDDARDTLRRALAVATTSQHHAEAQTLLAECALVDGKYPEAARLYLIVADRYRDLPAGENALFAAARAQARSGSTEQARALLELYLRRYPRGKLRGEAQRRFDELE
jgi:hypothetical protein